MPVRKWELCLAAKGKDVWALLDPPEQVQITDKRAFPNYVQLCYDAVKAWYECRVSLTGKRHLETVTTHMVDGIWMTGFNCFAGSWPWWMCWDWVLARLFRRITVILGFLFLLLTPQNRDDWLFFLLATLLVLAAAVTAAILWFFFAFALSFFTRSLRRLCWLFGATWFACFILILSILLFRFARLTASRRLLLFFTFFAGSITPRWLFGLAAGFGCALAFAATGFGKYSLLLCLFGLRLCFRCCLSSLLRTQIIKQRSSLWFACLLGSESLC